MHPLSPEYMFVVLAHLRHEAEWDELVRGAIEARTPQDRARRRPLRALVRPARRCSPEPTGHAQTATR